MVRIVKADQGSKLVSTHSRQVSTITLILVRSRQEKRVRHAAQWRNIMAAAPADVVVQAGHVLPGLRRREAQQRRQLVAAARVLDHAQLQIAPECLCMQSLSCASDKAMPSRGSRNHPSMGLPKGLESGIRLD